MRIFEFNISKKNVILTQTIKMNMKNLITLLTLFTILASCGGGGGGTATITPTVEDPKTLLELLSPGSGHWDWAACTEFPKF